MITDATPLILTVADNPLLRDLIEQHVADWGYHYRGVWTATELWEALNEGVADVILLDVALGNTDGATLFNRVFATCYSGYGLDKSSPGEPENLKRHLLCVHRLQASLTVRCYSGPIPRCTVWETNGGNRHTSKYVQIPLAHTWMYVYSRRHPWWCYTTGGGV